MKISASPTPHPLLTDRKALATFLSTHWGKRPVLFRNLLPCFRSPLSPDELAGLACEPATNARIIQGSGAGPYQLKLGPFEDADFTQLPDKDWTLLVQDVNRLVPQLADLLDQFSFIPTWRVDDIMVSYAAPGGGVGPHVDNYDVFLVQGLGKRLWQIGYRPIPPQEELLVEDCDVRVLRDGFVPDDEWVLEPGDVLYVPPRFPHHGISLDDECMTYSVGFRAPAIADLVHGWADDIVQRDTLHQLFLQDIAKDLMSNMDDPGRITTAAIDHAYETVMNRLAKSERMRKRFAVWFAEEVSQPRRFRSHEADVHPLEESEARKMVDATLSSTENHELRVRRQEGSVFTYLVDSDGEVALYIDGERWPVECVEIAQKLCDARVLEADALAQLAMVHPSLRRLLERLFQADLLYIEESVQSESNGA